jgi:hypothetical protein
VVWTGRSCPAMPSKPVILVDVAPRARTNNLRFKFILLIKNLQLVFIIDILKLGFTAFKKIRLAQILIS